MPAFAGRETPDGKRVYLHHVVLGEKRWPAELADHVNRIRLDNRRANLRWLKRSESQQNVGPQRRNASGLRGAHWDRANGRWKAAVRTAGRTISLGYFDTAQQAAARAAEARRGLFPFSTEGVGA